MSDPTKPPEPAPLTPAVPEKRPPGFQKGHPKYGGRAKGSPYSNRLKFARDYAAEMKVDPVQFMLMVLAADTIEVADTEKDGRVKMENGKVVMKKVAVPMDMRMDAAKSVAPYVHARLQTTQVTGANGGPVKVAAIPTAEIISNPKLAEAMTELAFFMTENRLLEAPEESDE